jgi:hypothetical protein
VVLTHSEDVEADSIGELDLLDQVPQPLGRRLTLGPQVAKV